MASSQLETSDAAPFPDWSTVYPPVHSVLSLESDPEFQIVLPTRIRGLFVALNTLLPHIEARKNPRGPVEIHADVLRIEGEVNLNVSALSIHARRIEAPPGALLIFGSPDEEPDGSVRTLKIDASEVAGRSATPSLAIDCFGLRQTFEPGPGGSGFTVRFQQGDAGETRLSASHRPVSPCDPLMGALLLMAAKALVWGPSDAHGSRELAIHITQWVRRTSLSAGGEPSLLAESTTLAERIRKRDGALHFVPTLRRESYFKLAQVTAQALESVERQYDKFFDRQLGIDARMEAARQMLEHYRSTETHSQNLLEQTRTEMEKAAQANEAAARKMDAQLGVLDTAKEAFEAGVEAKKAQLEREAVLAIAFAVVSLGVGIAVACTGNPAGAAAAASGAEKAKSVGEKVSRLKKIMEKIAKAMEAIQKLKAALEKMKALYDAIQNHMETRRIVDELSDVVDDRAAPPAAMTGADWDVFTVDMRSLFETPISLEIEGARDYLKALEIVAIRGKDCIDSGFYFSDCARRYQERLWACERDRRDMDRIETLMDAIEGSAGPGFEMLFFYEQLRVRLKLRMIQAVETIGDAFRYYALREPTTRTSVTDSGAQLARSLADAEFELTHAREQFAAPPGTWGPTVYRVWAGESLARLKAERTFSWTLSQKNFRGFDRIRIEEIRVWLIGAMPGREGIQVRIATSGVYQDRLGGRMFSFAGPPLKRSFAYRPDPNGSERDYQGNPVTITARADDTEKAFFQPTPFTTWELSLPEPLNPGLALDNVSEIGLEFLGSYIPGPFTVARAPAAAPNDTDEALDVIELT